VLLKSLETKNSEYEALQMKLLNSQAELESVRAELASQARQHEIAISDANKEIAKRDVQIEVLSKSNEANEKRLIHFKM
jgi:predicted RNase H-like nuclease (RuvC/YqgF family)